MQNKSILSRTVPVLWNKLWKFLCTAALSPQRDGAHGGITLQVGRRDPSREVNGQALYRFLALSVEARPLQEVQFLFVICSSSSSFIAGEGDDDVTSRSSRIASRARGRHSAAQCPGRHATRAKWLNRLCASKRNTNGFRQSENLEESLRCVPVAMSPKGGKNRQRSRT